MAMAVATDDSDDAVDYWVEGSAACAPLRRERRPELHLAAPAAPSAPVRRLRIARRRRRRLVGAAVIVGLLTLLALPLQALGGAPAPRRATSALAGATVYVVQPGDTVWSIAQRFDQGGNPRPLARAIATETGSDTVVPKERIAIP